MKQKPISTIRNQVYLIIKEEICKGNFKPGQWLQEKELADQLSVSRSPVREALRQLGSDGLVVEIPNKGVFVKEFTSRDIEEIYDMRVLLENYAIDRLGINLTISGSEKLQECLNFLEQAHACNDLHQYIKYDNQLHENLIKLCGNGLLETMYERVHSVIQQFRIYSLVSKKRFDESIDEHRGIIHGLLSGDIEEAKRINRLHLQLAKDKIIEHLEGHSNENKPETE